MNCQHGCVFTIIRSWRPVFASEEGVRQGSVEGPYLFMLTVASLLARLDFPVLTYMDDVYILVDQASELEAVIKDVTHALSKGHFVVNCAKCAIISVSPIPNVYPFPTVNSPSMVLGAVVGNLHSCETCPELLAKVKTAFSVLHRCETFQGRWLLFHHCVLPMLRHIMLSTHPHFLASFSHEIDQLQIGLLQSLVDGLVTNTAARCSHSCLLRVAVWAFFPCFWHPFFTSTRKASFFISLK